MQSLSPRKLKHRHFSQAGGRGIMNHSSRENRLETDVLVVGGGFAGCFAALKAREQGADVILVDKGFTGKSGQSPFTSGMMVFNPDWGHELDDWMNYINKASEYLNNREWNEIIIKESYARFQDLVSWGVEFKKNKGETIRVCDPWGVTESVHFSNSARSDIFSANKNHAYILRKQALKNGVRILDRITVTELLKQGGRIAGAIGIPLDSYDLYTFIAKTTIMCVGACGFKPAGYPPLVQLTCDGEAMAYRAGAEILGKEFVDTHITLVDFPAICARLRVSDALEPLLGREASLLGMPFIDKRINAEGNKVPDRPAGASGEKFSYPQLEFEAHAGRAPIYWRTEVGDKELVGAAALGMSVRKADGIWPANTNCASSLPGLYAAGDALGNMQNGAVYAVGGSSIAGCAVTGAIAGVAAAKEALQMGKLMVNEKEIGRAKQVVHAPIERQGGFSPRWVTQVLQNTMLPYFISYIKKADR